MAGRKTKRGTSGNAVQYVTRNQALKRLQIHLGEFRRLCILKGIHPREPKKKTQGQHKTYYHVKDLSFLAHEPILNKLREQHAYEKKVRKAKAKRNAELAQQLMTRRPTYTLDRLVKERYPSFMDALRDLDDPLTLTNLFAVLPAKGVHGIPAAQVAVARRLALEWQAYVVRSHALRKVFVSVKGFYFQAEVMGQTITWLVPHQLSQVLPNDVDYRVMLTFLEFYTTLLRFVHFRLYHSLGAVYPPRVDDKLDAAAAGISALMADLAAAAAAPATLPAPAQQQKAASVPAAAPQMEAAADSGADAAAEMALLSDDDNDDALSIDSGAGASSDDDEASSPEASDEEEAVTEPLPQRHVAAAAAAVEASAEAPAPALEPPQTDAAEALATAAGGALAVAHNDDAAICSTLFSGLVFFLGREVPREQLLLVIRSFGGTTAWAGEGSPLDEADEAITHQVVDRPTQGHRFLSRQYVQPQWVFDSANFRVLAEAGRYAPGAPPPPHLSPFVSMEGGDEEEHVPDYALELRRLQNASALKHHPQHQDPILQDAAKAAREHAAGAVDREFLEEAQDAAAGEASAPTAEPDADAEAAAAEAAYHAELRAELQAAQEEAIDEGVAEGAAEPAAPAQAKLADAPASDEAAMADIMLTRKKRKLYQSVVAAKAAKKARAQQLKERAS